MTAPAATTPLPSRPWPAAYAIAYRTLEAERTARSARAHPRGDAYRRALGELTALRNLALDLGFAGAGRATTSYVVLVRDLLEERPPEPGPEWLKAVTLVLAERLTAR